MNNESIADIFDEMADLLELDGENAFRIRAYRNGSAAIRGLDENVKLIIEDASRKLTDIEGVGKTLAEKCETLVTTGELPALDKLRAKIPRGLLGVMKVPGVGAKKAAALYKNLEVTDLETLRVACEAEQVQSLKGFGKKTEQKILDGLAIAEQANRRLRIDQADRLVQALQDWFNDCAAVERLDFAGSYRRGKETVGDLDILVISQDVAAVMDHFENFESRTETIVRGDTKMSIRVKDAFQIDLRVVAQQSWGAAMQYFTGSKEHNVRVRSIAKKQSLRVNEYGVFPGDEDINSVAGATEEEVYASIGLPWIPPELRETRTELDANTQLPELIEISDIRGDMHMHTNATDGQNTLEEMVAAAQKIGLEYIAITDHSKRVSMANGLNEERAIEQWNAIDTMNDQLEGTFRIFKGIECDILENATLDLSDECLSKADWVMASVHYGQQQSEQQITDRILMAIKNPHVSAIAHPTGRLIGRRKPYAVDMNAVMQAADEYGKLLELNAAPQRLDLNATHCTQAKQQNIPIVISTDSHTSDSFQLMRFGIQQARRAGLTADDVFNSKSLAEVEKCLPGRH